MDTNHDFATAFHNLAVSRAKLEAACEAGIDDDAAVAAYDEALKQFASAPASTPAEWKVKAAEYARWKGTPELECGFGPVQALGNAVITDAERLLAA